MIVTLVALLALVGCSTVSADCSYPIQRSIPLGTRCDVGVGRFEFQRNGNAVIYDGNGKTLWSTSTDGTGHDLVFQNDGNLVVYTRDGKAKWSSGSQSNGGERLIFQNDRNLVIYNKANRPIWASQTDDLSYL